MADGRLSQLGGRGGGERDQLDGASEGWRGAAQHVQFSAAFSWPLLVSSPGASLMKTSGRCEWRRPSCTPAATKASAG
ncbi:hypothetical protein V9T40_004757 [Parthenolecanium corni]|uniref:Uncharacterized protein n=1 Tax=Parthenolecanium corni TaxID=536013 RepID=A0AAN9TEN6_9HEMI